MANIPPPVAIDPIFRDTIKAIALNQISATEEYCGEQGEVDSRQ
jgi:hypothetical protein